MRIIQQPSGSGTSQNAINITIIKSLNTTSTPLYVQQSYIQYIFTTGQRYQRLIVLNQWVEKNNVQTPLEASKE